MSRSNVKPLHTMQHNKSFKSNRTHPESDLNYKFKEDDSPKQATVTLHLSGFSGLVGSSRVRQFRAFLFWVFFPNRLSVGRKVGWWWRKQMERSEAVTKRCRGLLFQRRQEIMFIKISIKAPGWIRCCSVGATHIAAVSSAVLVLSRV